MIDMNMRQHNRVQLVGRNRAFIPVAVLERSLLEHAAIDEQFLVSHFETVAGSSDLAVGTQKVDFHGFK